MYEDPSKLKVVADNIRMKSPGKIYINWAKINFKKRIDTVSRKHFNDHTDTKHSGNKFVCTWCVQAFAEKRCLRIHTLFVHDIIEFPCNKCTFKVTIQGYLQRHILWIHEGKGLQCKFCDNRPAKKSAMAKNIELINGVGNQPNTKKQHLYLCLVWIGLRYQSGIW